MKGPDIFLPKKRRHLPRSGGAARADGLLFQKEMQMIWWCIGSFVLGGMIGVVVAGLLASSARAEECARCRRLREEAEGPEDVYAPI